MAIIERLGGLGATGIAKEATFGTLVTPTQFIPFAENTIQADPGWFSPPLINSSRSKQIYDGYGQEKIEGALTYPLLPTMGIPMLVGSVGLDAQVGMGVTIQSSASATTLSASAAASASSVTVTSATGLAIGDIIQIDVNSVTGSTTAECVKITAINTDTLTISPALNYSHASGVTVYTQNTNSPFVHTIIPNNTLPSFTIERNMGNYQSQQYGGCRVNKSSIKAQATNQEVQITTDIIGQSANVLATPSAFSYDVEAIYTFTGASLTQIAGANPSIQVSQMQNVTFNIDNALQAEWTMANSNLVQFLTPGALTVNGEFELIWSSLNDTNFGYFYSMLPGQAQNFNLSITIQQPNTGSAASGITLNMPLCKVTKLKDDVKLGEDIKSTVSFEALRDLSVTPATEVTLTVINSVYTPY